MKDIEKNDVDISKLFKWGQSMTLATPKKDITIWLKILGDADTNRARIYALRRSTEMRAKLLDLDSDERIGLIPVLDTSNKTRVVELLLTLLVKEIAAQADKNVKIKYPTEPASTASLEEQEKHQAIVDNFPKYVTDLTKKAINKEVVKERKRLNKLSIKALEELYIDTSVNHICEGEMYNAFQNKAVSMSCFQDDNYIIPMFSDVDDFLNLPTEVKNQIIDFYATLAIDVDTLKKSPEVMQ